MAEKSGDLIWQWPLFTPSRLVRYVALMDVMVVAGEASGDQHAANAVAALKRLNPGLRFFGMGGPKLAAEGVELLFGAHEISVMGIVEVLPKIPRIAQVLRALAAAARARRPAVALLVDVPDFNLRLAKKLKALGIPVVGYVAPMAWAWREGRTKIIAQRFDALLCILPFEEGFFRKRGVNATYVGCPLLDVLPAPNTPAHFQAALNLSFEGQPSLAVLPGSRESEIRRLGPSLAHACRTIAERHPGTQLVVPVAPGLQRALVAAPFLAAGVQPHFVDGRAAEVVGACDVALVASGTATLEAALMERPLVAVYRVSPVSYAIGKLLVRLPHFCLVNLLAGRAIVPELLQGDMTAQKMADALEPLWKGSERARCLADIKQLRHQLGEVGASARVAAATLEVAKTAFSGAVPPLSR